MHNLHALLQQKRIELKRAARGQPMDEVLKRRERELINLNIIRAQLGHWRDENKVNPWHKNQRLHHRPAP